MLFLRWALRMVLDVLKFGAVNRSPGLAMLVLSFLLMGLVIIGAQVSAPFIYTLF